MPTKDLLTLCLIQADLHWHDPEANRAALEEIIREHGMGSDVVVLPEMFTSGFTMQPEAVYDIPGGRTYRWMSQMAEACEALVIGSAVIRHSERYYNRLLAAHPNGQIQCYDKRHLFRMAGEHEHYAPGLIPLTIPFRGWRLRPLVCYDLRFPVWARNRNTPSGHDGPTSHDGLEYDALIYVANWPVARERAWNTLLPARAIENLAYCVGVNRVGQDANGHPYQGDSAVYNYMGEAIAHLGHEPKAQKVVISQAELRAYRDRFQAWRDADPFTMPL